MSRSVHHALCLLLCTLFTLLTLTNAAAETNTNTTTPPPDLPPGVIRGPLLHEHSFHRPLVEDWWQEGIPHFMIGGAAIATSRFLRLTGNALNDHGFAFNTAPLDHADWELRLKLSVRAPPQAVLESVNTNTSNSNTVHYEGGDGMALWYLERPIGDDHQHVVKYSKTITPEMQDELLTLDNPWRIADLLLNDDEDEDEDEAENEVLGENEEDLTEREKAERVARRTRRALKRQKREELYRRLFKRGTSFDASEEEPRIMGVKYSDFTRGLAIVLDSVGRDESDHLRAHAANHTAAQHHHHRPAVYVLLNLPAHKEAEHNESGDDGKEQEEKVVNTTGTQKDDDDDDDDDDDNTQRRRKAVPRKLPHNNFNASEHDFRRMTHVLYCEYDFRQAPSRLYTTYKGALQAEANTAQGNANEHDDNDEEDEEKAAIARALAAPEKPVELLVRYYKKKLSVILRREQVHKRATVAPSERQGRMEREGHLPPTRPAHTQPNHLNGKNYYNEYEGGRAEEGEEDTERYEIRRTYKETLCGELYPVELPLHYHLGLSASTGHPRRHARNARKAREARAAYEDSSHSILTHVDVHDVLEMQLRELGLDAKAMGYSKTIPLEHFDYERDQREREHFSRQIPLDPDTN